MNAAASQEITGLLKAWGLGEPSALDRLIPLVYRELKRMARRHMRRSDSGTIQTTALVNEAYLRLVDLSSVDWQDRAHFYAVSARIMRGILVDAARARGAQKLGGLLQRVDRSINFDLDQIPDLGSGRAAEILAINEALDCLAKMDPRQVRVVEMRFFGGLSVEETAEVLKISPQGVMRDWKLAKVWLRREMRKGAGSGARVRSATTC
jgi:RNA polymerase sigma factor (TIGR02999 family)